MYCVYHISDADDLNDGYIGVTKRPQKRWEEHSSSDSMIGRTIRLCSWNFTDNFKVIFEGSREECFAYERRLRPIPYVGLNEAAGGNGGDIIGLSERWKKERVGAGNPNYGKVRSQATRDAMSRGIKKSFENCSPERWDYLKTQLSRQGADSVKGTSWWNDGTKNVRRSHSPGDGWKKGRLRYERKKYV